VRVLVVSSGRVLYVVSIAWARMELTMLLKKVIVPSFHFYLFFRMLSFIIKSVRLLRVSCSAPSS